MADSQSSQQIIFKYPQQSSALPIFRGALNNRWGKLNDSEAKIKSLIAGYLNGGVDSIDSATEALDPGAPNYWHFVAYVLPTILENRDNSGHFLVADSMSYVHEYALLIGVDCSRLIPMRNKALCVERLTLSGERLPCQNRNYNPYTGLIRISRKLRGLCKQVTEGKWIFIDRMSSNNGSGYRRVMPDADWKAFIIKQGFEVVCLEGMSAIEQIRIFSEAEVVMAMHGAGLTNCIYMNPQTTIIELMHIDGIENGGYLDMFMQLARVMGLRYFRVPCQPFLDKAGEARLQLITGNPSTNPLPVKYTKSLEICILDILKRIKRR